MTDARTIVYRLRAVQDPSSQSQIRAFGKSISDALNPRGRSGNRDDFSRMADGLKKSASAASDLEKQMKRVNDAHNSRVATEERSSRAEMAAIDKRIAALRRLDAQNEAAARREEQREHSRHRQRQRRVAISGRAQRSSLEGVSDYEGGGAVDRPGEMAKHVDHATAAHSRLHRQIKLGTHALIEMGHGFAQLGVLGEQSSEQMFRGLLKVESAFNILRGLKMGAGALGIGGIGMGAIGAGVGIAAGIGLGAKSAYDVHAMSRYGQFRPWQRQQYSTKLDTDAGRHSMLGRVGLGIASLGLYAGEHWNALHESDLRVERQRKESEYRKEVRRNREEDAAPESEMMGERVSNRLEHSERRRGAISSARNESRSADTNPFVARGSSDSGALLGDIGDLAAKQKDVNDELEKANRTLATQESLRRVGLETQSEINAASEVATKMQERKLGLMEDEKRLHGELLRQTISKRNEHVDKMLDVEQRYGAHKEAFGNMQYFDQQRYKRLSGIATQALRGGGRDASGNKKLSYHGARLLRSVTKEDREFLAQHGTERDKDFARTAAYDEASRNGYEGTQAAADFRKEAGFHEHAAAQYQKLAVNIVPKVDIAINPPVKEMTDALTARVLNQMDVYFKALNKEIDRKIANSRAATADKNKEEKAQQNNQHTFNGGG